jgi:hypothetical protein
MMSIFYNLFKFLHIVSATIWIGGTFTLIVLNTRLARSGNRAVMEPLARQAEFFGRAVLGPAMGGTLLAGMITAGLMGVRFTTLWILWGFAGVFGSLILGTFFIRRATLQIGRLAAQPPPAEGLIPATGANLAAAQRRLAALNWLNLLLLLSVVMAMVFKPV